MLVFFWGGVSGNACQGSDRGGCGSLDWEGTSAIQCAEWFQERHRTERKPNELSKESQPCRLLQFGLLLLPMPHVRHSFSSLGYDCVQRQRLRGQGKPPPLQRNNWLAMAPTRHTTPLSFGIAGAVESACGVALIKSRILPLCDSHVTPHHPFHVPCAPSCLKITQHQLSGREK